MTTLDRCSGARDPISALPRVPYAEPEPDLNPDPQRLSRVQKRTDATSRALVAFSSGAVLGPSEQPPLSS